MTKTIIVTGASRGIGAATAVRAGQNGWRVCVNYNSSPDKAEEVAAAVKVAGGEAFTFKASQGVESELIAMFEEVDKRWALSTRCATTPALITRSKSPTARGTTT